MDVFGKIFSGRIDLSRVNPWGIALMLLAVALLASAGWLAARTNGRIAKNSLKLAALVICAGGALLAILG